MMKILLVDDDAVFNTALAAAFRKRGYETATAETHEEALRTARNLSPDRIVLDLKIPGTSGLRLIPDLLAIVPKAQIVVLTGYANVATAVEAIKLGACHYLSKPVGMEEIISAFQKTEGDTDLPIGETSHITQIDITRLDVMEWNHIQSVLEKNGGNISATARELNMHRRTLQRKLYKRSPQG